MGKINGCLKCLFVFFNVIYAIFGCVMLYGQVKASSYSHQIGELGGPSNVWGWLFAIGVLGIACLGIYAGISENALALKIFAGFMVAGLIVMMIFGIIMVVARDKVKEAFDNATTEQVKPYLASKDINILLQELQKTAQCCGVVSSEDWGDTIPNSCACKPADGDRSVCKSGSLLGRLGVGGPDQIYKQPCSEVIVSWSNFFFNILMGFFFGLAVTALLGLLISYLMYHQVRRHNSAGGASFDMKSY